MIQSSPTALERGAAVALPPRAPASRPLPHRPELPRLVKALVRTKPAAALAMIEYARLTSQPEGDNDNLNLDMSEVSGFGLDYRHRQRDDGDAMVSDACRARVVTERRKACPNAPARAIIFRHDPFTDSKNPFDVKVQGARIHVGSMVFDTAMPDANRPGDGLLVEFGRDKRGRPIVPQIEVDGARGAAAPQRSKDAVLRYLSIPADDAERDGWRKTAGNDNAPNTVPYPRRAALAELGIDGSVDFAEARRRAGLPDAEKLPTGVGHPGGFMGGEMHPKGSSRTAESQNAPDRQNPREGIGGHVSAVIEEGLAGGTFQDIGRLIGARKSYAGRSGKRAWYSAADALLEARSDSTRSQYTAAA